MEDNVNSNVTPGVNKAKLIKYILTAGIGAAGVGAFLRNLKSKKTRKDALDVSKAKNTIIVPINKEGFLGDLPTPNEHASSMAESIPAQSLSGPKPTSSVSKMTDEEIAAKKKEILRRGGRKVDFFKRAEKQDAEKPTEKKNVPAKKDGDKKEITIEEVSDGRVIFRSQDGKFVSPTDPVAVEQVEKTAVDGVKDLLIHPIDSLGRIGQASVKKPLMYTLGTVGSLVLAAKIADYINRTRRKHSEGSLEESRKEYVDLLEGKDGEKKASSDVRDMAGMTLGGAFFVPMALTAIVTNKILENRREERKKQKEMTDSYPDEPIILYKTSECSTEDEVQIPPETAVAMVVVKRAMIESVERLEFMEKSASLGGDWTWRMVDKPFNEFVDAIKDPVQTAKNTKDAFNIWNNVQLGENGMATDDSIKALSGDDYDESLFNLINAWATNGKAPFVPMPGMSAKIKALSRDPRFLKLLQQKFSNSGAAKYNERWGKLQNTLIDRELGKTFGKDGFGGWLRSIIGWFAKNTPLGGWMVRRGLDSKFKTLNPNANPGAQPNAQTPATGQPNAANPAQTQSGNAQVPGQTPVKKPTARPRGKPRGKPRRPAVKPQPQKPSVAPAGQQVTPQV